MNTNSRDRSTAIRKHSGVRWHDAASARAGSQSGVALIITLAVLVLATALVLALLLSVSSERTDSSASFQQGEAQNLAAGVVDLVKSTITQATAGYESDATTGALNAAKRTAWASQPGLIRTWDESGAAYKTYRLYSSGRIVNAGAIDLTTEQSDLNGWKSGGSSFNALWCDLNAPAASGTNANSLSYPIVTPPKDDNSGSTATDSVNGVPTDKPSTATQEGVQGFAVTSAPGFSSGTTPGPTNNPAPMPVKWLYVLQDGTFVAPIGNASQVTVDGASPANPIVGRVAYWTDDETCKVNVNTASEGVYWDKPYGFNREESGISASSTVAPVLGYSVSIPSTDEFQRLPGHPAFTSLSAVFGGTNWITRPDIGFSATGFNGAATYTGGTFDNNMLPYYNMVPRIGDGGTKGGTRFIADPTLAGNRILLDPDRLYASSDEFLFSTNASSPRSLNNSSLTPERVKQTSFFVTANSKAPETTLLEQPRVSLWPIQQSASARNAKDRLLAFGATIKGSSDYPYYFQRVSEWQSDNSPGSSQSVSTDISLDRNLKLLNYLNHAAKTNAPGFGSSLSEKYKGAKLGQILVEMFDSIRSLVNTTSRSVKESPSLPNGYSYAPYKAGTDPQKVVGVGSVVPAVAGVAASGNIDPNGATKIKGFGRWPVVSEVMLIFMATQWKDDTKFASSEWQNATPADEFTAEGATFYDPSVRWKPSAGSDGLPDDFPNGPYAATNSKVGLNAAQLQALVDAGRTNNLGNLLVTNTSVPQFYIYDDQGVGDPQTTQVQAFVLLSFLNPSPGQPDLAPAVRYQIAGLDSLSINGNSLGFASSNNAVLLSRNFNVPHPCPEVANEMQLTAKSDSFSIRIAKDSTGVSSGPLTTDDANSYFPFLSQKVLVPTAEAGQWGLTENYKTNNVTLYQYSQLRPNIVPSTMYFSGGNISIRVFPGVGTNFSSADCIQTINMNIPAATLPVPLIIRPYFKPKKYDEKQMTGNDWMLPDFDSEKRDNNDQVVAVIRPDNKDTPEFYAGLGTNTASIVNGTTRISAKADARYFSTISANGSQQPGAGRMDLISLGDYRLGATTQGAWLRRGDVVRSMVLNPTNGAKGDIRLMAGLTDVPASFFAPSGGISTYTDSTLLQAAGATSRGGNLDRRGQTIYGSAPSTISNPHSWKSMLNRDPYEALGKLVGVAYSGSGDIRPNVPRPVGPSVAFNSVSDVPIATRGATANPGDWNTGVGNFFDGPYINSGDQGYLYKDAGTNFVYGNFNMYYPTGTGDAGGNASLASFSPNRQVASPVLFGSLPSGIDPANPANSLPWQTLLFCPNPADRTSHPGFGSGGSTSGPDARPPFSIVPDHLFLDLFWMPVVEPYAISEPFATAGKINLNYQMAPFTHIERTTGLYAAVKAMKLPALPDARSADYKKGDTAPLDPSKSYQSQQSSPSWRYNIDVAAVLAGMKDRRFSKNDVYRSASEVATIFMVPSPQPGSPNSPAGPSGAAPLARYNNTASWWDDKLLSGDNLRETPYDQLYSRITTKSNTYTVHMRVQSLKQTGAAGWNKWDEAKDQVMSEYRGSATIERYVDPNDTSIPDFADSNNYSKNLAPYYRWRTLAQRQFIP